MGETCPEVELLGGVGVQVHFEDIWEGTHPNRTRRPDLAKVRNIRLPFTPDDWWEMTTRDGNDYIGPCCGTSGAMQDIICSAYRDGGWIDGKDLLSLGQLGESHADGFEDWGKAFRGKGLEKKIAKWASLDRWARIGVIYRALKPLLKTSERLHDRGAVEQERDILRVLRTGLMVLSYQDLFERPAVISRQEQEHANRLLLIARITPAAKKLLESIRGYAPFEGFAIVVDSSSDRVLDNHHGACIYKTEEGARETIEATRKVVAETEGQEMPSVSIRPVRVSAEHGLEFTDGK